ncbi:MAG: 4-hydroxy-tetrahydrodipicolinate reductase [Clostridia bacterium]
MTKLIINGIGGRIGHSIYDQLLKNNNYTVVAGVDKHCDKNCFDIPVYDSITEVTELADVIIDFSVPDALNELIDYAVKHNIKLVTATTGHSNEQLASLEKAAENIAIFKASNMSLGVNILISLAKETAGFLGSDYDIEIIEQHHNKKYDSPSGTALSIADAINSVRNNQCEYVFGRHNEHLRRSPTEIGIHSIRGGSIVGKHDVMYISSGEIITLSHESQNKEVFVQGSLRAIEFILDKPFGLYNMNSIIGAVYAVTNVTVENDITLITIPKITATSFVNMLEKLGAKQINLDMISQTLNHDDTVSVSFTLPDNSNNVAYQELFTLNTTYFSKENTSKITSEGAGMAHQCGVAKDVLQILNRSGASIYSITTSETKISCCIDTASVLQAEQALKQYYKL